MDAVTARENVARLKADLQDLARESPNVQVSVDAARAATELAQVEREVDKLDGRKANVSVDVRANWMTGAIGAGALGVGAALAPAAGLLAALPAAGLGAAGAFGAVYASIQGVSAGVKALDTFEKQQTANAVQNAARQVSAANSIANAQDAVRSAVRGVSDAQHAADLANEAASRQVRSALAGQQRAEESLAAAQRQEVSSTQALQRAQDALTEARKAAQRQLEDLAAQTADGALAERRALLNVQQAKADLDKTLADTTATDLQRQQAQLTYDEAVQHLSDQRLRNRQLAEDKADADRRGVEGSKQVQQAQQGVSAATQGVADAQRGVADAQRGVADAADALAVAQKQATETQRQGAENVAKAQEQVVSTTRALQTAMAAAGAQGSAALGALNQAMGELSPSAQQFAHFLHDEVIPGLKGIRDQVQVSTLPLVEQSFRNLGQLSPMVANGLSQTAQIMGELAVKGTELMTTGPWRRDMAATWEGNNAALHSFGIAGLNVMDMMRNLAAEAVPLIRDIADMTARLTEQGAAWLQTKRDTGELAQFMHEAGDALHVVLEAAGKVAVAAIQLAQALAPMGLGIVTLVGDLAEFVGWLSKIDPQLAQVAALAIGLAPVLGRLGAAWDAVTGAVRFFAASNLEAKFQSVALGAGTATEKLVGYAAGSETAAAAGEKVASAGGRVAGVAARIGSTLPVVGVVAIGASVAFDALTTSAGDAADAMLQGGAAAAQMAESMKNQSRFASLAHNDLVSFVPLIGPIVRVVASWTSSTDDATRAMKDQLAAMDPLHRAQALAAQAQNNYLDAVDRYGPTSLQAINADRDLALQSQELKKQQDLLSGALNGTTDAVARQRDTVLGTLDADLRWHESLLSLNQTVQQNGANTDLSTEAGQRNRRALLDLTNAAFADIDAMTKRGASQADITARTYQHRDALIAAAIQTGMTRDEARRYVDQLNVTPHSVTTTFIADTGGAMGAIWRFKDDVNGAMVEIRDADIQVLFHDTGNILRAQGGAVYGPGTETSDSIPARLSHGEHVWTAQEVRGAGGHGQVAMMRKMAAAGRVPGFAAGGPVAREDVFVHFHPVGLDVVQADYGRFVHDAAERDIGSSLPGPGDAVERWRPVGLRALAIADQSATNIDRLLMQMRTESGGRTDAINRYDINWQRGHPSVGLMQVIACVPLTTRILTRDGWKNHADVCVGDETIGFNPETSCNEWTRITRVMHYEDAEVWSIGNGSWRAEVTPSHRWFSDRRHRVAVGRSKTCPECGRSWSTERGMETHLGRMHHKRLPEQVVHQGRFVETNDLRGDDRIRVAAPATTEGIPWLSLEEVRLVAWIQGDGSITPVPGSDSLDVSIYQSKPAQIVKLRSLLARLPHGEYVRDRGGNTIPAHQFKLRRAAGTELVKRSRILEIGPEEFVLALSPEQRAAWLDSMIDAEGNRQTHETWREFVRIAQRDGGLQEAIKLAVYLEGFRPSVSRLKRLQEHHAPAALIGMCGPHVAANMFSDPVVLDRQPVWCVETELGTWTMQQHGVPVLTGNSTYDHYHHPAYNRPPFEYGVSEDAISNILASIRYTVAHYGSLAAGWQGHGYDLGGILQSGRFAVNASGHPERVLDPRTTQAFERLVSVLSTVRGSMPLVLSAPQQAQVQGAIQMAAPELAALGRVISQELQRVMPSLDGLKLQIADDGRNGVARIVQRQVRDLTRSGWTG